MVNADSPLVLQHVVGLRLGTPIDLSSSLPTADLDRTLCDNSFLPSLIRKRRWYWSEINPILQKWQSIHDTKCLECNRVIPINMARHLRLEHMTCQCFWRCPVASCPSWFASEFDGKVQRGPWLLLLQMFMPIWIGMVWPSLVLRSDKTFRPGFTDGHRTRKEIRTGTTQRLRHHRQSGI